VGAIETGRPFVPSIHSHPFTANTMTTQWIPPTAAEINRAKGEELNYWITQINAGSNKKTLTKAGTVHARRQKIADHLGIDLTLAPSLGPPVAPVGVDEQIRKAQWTWALQLGQEWADKEAAGQPFHLWPTETGVQVVTYNPHL
jgi:hypothetical protein